jgi:hypothetical protein
MKHTAHMGLQHSQSVKFNMPMPQLVHSNSSNAAPGTMRNNGNQNNDGIYHSGI